MPKHDPTDEAVLDLATADLVLVRYKRGDLTLEQARIQLKLCGYPSHLIAPLLMRVDSTPLEQVERELLPPTVEVELRTRKR